MTKVIGGSIPPKEHAKLKMEDTANHALDRLLYAQPKFFKGVRKDCMYRPSDLGPLWLSLGEMGRFLEPPDVDSPDFLGWPMRFAFALPDPEEHGRLITTAIRSVSPQELRGKVKTVGRFNLEFLPGTLAPNLEFQGARRYLTWTGGRWLHNLAHTDNPYKVEQSMSIQAHMSFSAALTYRYEWGAQFSAGAAKVIVPVSPAGVLELFNDRDKPENGDRRAALRHWVNAHLRKKPTVEDEFVPVRGHLRGQFDFKWRGFDVRIVPSAYDIDRGVK